MTSPLIADIDFNKALAPARAELAPSAGIELASNIPTVAVAEQRCSAKSAARDGQNGSRLVKTGQNRSKQSKQVCDRYVDKPGQIGSLAVKLSSFEWNSGRCLVDQIEKSKAVTSSDQQLKVQTLGDILDLF
eukprot:s638_g17.t1